jgi:hypothetical protein
VVIIAEILTLHARRSRDECVTVEDVGVRLVLMLVLGLALSRPAAALPVVADSPALVLRASHIVRVEIVSAADDGVDGQRRPMTAMRVRVIEVLKGTLAGGAGAGASADVRVVHYPPGTPTTARHYGVWSYTELTPGARFVVIAAGAAGDAALADLVVDPAAIAVLPPETADEIHLIDDVDRLTFARAIAKARPRAASLGGLFADYVLARRHDRRDADALAALVELPALAREARTTFVMSVESWSAGDPATVDRMALALFRLLRLDEAAPLRDNLIGTWIPSLVGITSGEAPRSAAQVFRGRAGERRLTRAALDAYRGTESTAALLTWLR